MFRMLQNRVLPYADFSKRNGCFRPVETTSNQLWLLLVTLPLCCVVVVVPRKVISMVIMCIMWENSLNVNIIGNR